MLQHSLIADILAHEGVKGVELKEMVTGIFLGAPLFSFIALD